MLIKDYQKFINLSRLLNTSFGSNSSNHGRVYQTQSIKFDLLDDGLLKIRYLTIVNFGSDTMMRELMVRYRQEAISMIEAALKTVKENYAKEFPGQTVPNFKLEEETIGEDIEYISYYNYTGNRKAYYRFGCLVEVD
jgi:hypothetical protein